jgi:hypothetical protein
MKILVPVGRYETALWNGEKTALRGNLKLGTSAGLSTEPFVRASRKKAGGKR